VLDTWHSLVPTRNAWGVLVHDPLRHVLFFHSGHPYTTTVGTSANHIIPWVYYP
jgi:hypothetical protein